MSHIPMPHEIYKHFKGNLYQVLELAEHSETGEQLVIYQALYGEFKIYARSLPDFMDKVDKVKYPEATQEYRFELQGGNPCETKIGDENSECQQPAITQSTIEKNEQNQQNTMTEYITACETDSAENNIDPMVMEFLDAKTYEERLNILMGLKHRITHEMITTMAVACDIEVPEGEIEERFNGLKNCLLTLEKFECNRLR